MNHFYQHIFGWSESIIELYQEVIAALPADRPSVFVEIGAWFGRSASFAAVEIINSGKPIQLHVVDHWRGSFDDQTQSSYIRDNGPGSARAKFNENLASVMHVLTIHDEGSPAAAAKFADDSVDFCFIDGCHSEEAVTADIRAWAPKIREQGVIAGHDYNYGSVKAAVDREFGMVDIQGFCWKKTR